MDYIHNLILKCSQRIYSSINYSDGVNKKGLQGWSVDLNILLSFKYVFLKGRCWLKEFFFFFFGLRNS